MTMTITTTTTTRIFPAKQTQQTLRYCFCYGETSSYKIYYREGVITIIIIIIKQP